MPTTLEIPAAGISHANAEVFDTADLAEYLKCSTELVKAMRGRGEGPRFFRVGTLVRYRKSDVERWIELKNTDGRASLDN